MITTLIANIFVLATVNEEILDNSYVKQQFWLHG